LWRFAVLFCGGCARILLITRISSFGHTGLLDDYQKPLIILGSFFVAQQNSG